MIGAQTRGPWRPWLVFMAVFVVLWFPLLWLLVSGWPDATARYFEPLLYLVSYELGWLVSLRVVGFRLLAVADDTVYILDCGHNAFLWPKRLVGTTARAPLEWAIGPGWVDLPGKRLFVPRAWRRQLRWADWEFYARNSLTG